MAPVFKTLVSALCLSAVATAGSPYARSPNAQAHHERQMRNVGRRINARSYTTASEDCDIVTSTSSSHSTTPTTNPDYDEDCESVSITSSSSGTTPSSPPEEDEDCEVTTTSAGPSTPSSTPGPSPPTRVMVNEIYKVWPQHPDRAAGPVPYIHVEAWANVSSVEQVAVFRGIPEGATNCVLGWAETDKIDRVFLEMGTPMLSASPLVGFSAAPNSQHVSYNAIKDYNTTGIITQPNFAWWTTSFDVARNHSSGTDMGCASEIYVHYKLHDTTMVDTEIEPALFMMADDRNGWFIRYE